MKIDELIKERNNMYSAFENIAKLTSDDARRAANIYIDNKYFDIQKGKKNDGEYGVFYYKDGNGEEWVRVVTYGHDFLLSLVDMPGAYTWEECKKYAEDSGYTLPSKEEWDIIDAYRDKIDKVIEDNGGNKLEGVYWSVAQYNAYAAWLYRSTAGRVNYDYKYYSFHGRALAYPSQVL